MGAGDLLYAQQDPNNTANFAVAQKKFDGARRGPLGFTPDPDPTTFIGLEFKPIHLEITGGIFGLQSDNQYFAPSPFVAIQGEIGTPPESRTQFAFRMKSGYLRLNSRLGAPEIAGTDAEIDYWQKRIVDNEGSWNRFRQELMSSNEFSRNWSQEQKDAFNAHIRGWSARDKKNLQRLLQATAPPNGGYEADDLFFASAQFELGQAFEIIPGLDIGGAIVGIVDTWTNARGPRLYPNLQTDASLGLRIHPGNSPMALGLFGGDSQNFSPVSGNITEDILTQRKLSDILSLNIEHAPHFGFGFWGYLPEVPDLYIEEQSKFQYNPLTVEQDHTLRLATRLGPLPFETNAKFHWEEGEEIDYLRIGGTLGFNLGIIDAKNASVAAGINGYYDNITYGAAQIHNPGFVVGLGGAWDFGPVVAKAQTAYSWRYVAPRTQPEVSQRLLEQKEAIEKRLKEHPLLGAMFQEYFKATGSQRVEYVQGICKTLMGFKQGHTFYQGKNLITGQTGTYYDNPYLKDCMEIMLNTPLAEAALKATTDPALLNQLALRALGNAVGEEIRSGDIFAGAAIAQRRLSPVPPIAQKQRQIFKEWLLYHTAKTLGLNISNFDSLPLNERMKRVADELRRRTIPASVRGGVSTEQAVDTLDALLDYGFNIANEQGMREVLEMTLAAEPMKHFSVSGGLDAAQMGTNAVIRSFERIPKHSIPKGALVPRARVIIPDNEQDD